MYTHLINILIACLWAVRCLWNGKDLYAVVQNYMRNVKSTWYWPQFSSLNSFESLV